MASLHLACLAYLRPGIMALATVSRQSRLLRSTSRPSRRAALPPPPPLPGAAAGRRLRCSSSREAADPASQDDAERRIAEAAAAVRLAVVQEYRAGRRGRSEAWPPALTSGALEAAAAAFLRAGVPQSALTALLSCASARRLAALAGERTPADLAALLAALQRELGWSLPQATAGLLGLGLRPAASEHDPWAASRAHAPLLSLAQATAEDVAALGRMLRERGLGGHIPHITLAAQADWAALGGAAEAAAAAAELEGEGVPPRQAALLWLAAGREATGPEWLGVLRELMAAGVAPGLLELWALLFFERAAQPAWWARGLRLLAALLGSWPAAAAAAAADRSLLELGRLPAITPALWEVCTRLGAAGLRRDQLLALAADAGTYAEGVGSFALLAERLYAGDWGGAARRYLADRAALCAALPALEGALEGLEGWGLEAANDAGRERVLQYILGGPPSDIDWSVRLPPGVPPEHRADAAEAALEEAGFVAVGGLARELLSAMAAGEVASFGMLTSPSVRFVVERAPDSPLREHLRIA